MYAAYMHQRLSWLLLVVVLFAVLGSSTASPQPTAENTASDVNGRRYGHSDEHYPKVHKGRDRISFWELLLANPGGAPSPVRPSLPTPETKCDSLPAAPADSTGWVCGGNNKREHPTLTPGTTCTVTCNYAPCNGGRGTCDKQQRALIAPASFTITCGDDGTWTPKVTLECPAPAACALISLPQEPLNADSWDCPDDGPTQSDGTVCTARCDDESECIPKRVQPLDTVVCAVTITCNNGEWSQPEGTCPAPVVCFTNARPSPPNGAGDWVCEEPAVKVSAEVPDGTTPRLEPLFWAVNTVCSADCSEVCIGEGKGASCVKSGPGVKSTTITTTCQSNGGWTGPNPSACPDMNEEIPNKEGPVGGPAAN